MNCRSVRGSQSLTVLIIVGLAVSSSGFAATSCLQGQQPEPALACDESLEGTQGLLDQYGMHTTGCQISPRTETDKFRFIGRSGDKVRLVAFAYSGCIDLLLELRDPVGTLIGMNSCNGNPNGQCSACSFQLDVVLPATGTYSATLRDIDADEAGLYALQIERDPPIYCAPDLPHNATISDRLDPWTDTDFIAFEGVANTEIAVTLLGYTGCIDPSLVILDPAGSILAEGFCYGNPNGQCSACSFTIPAAGTLLPVTGRYTMIIRDSGQDEIGDYQISLACIFGACPLDPYARDLTWISRTTFQWTNNDVNASFDVDKGDLGILRSIGGDFTTAITSCLEPADGNLEATDTELPLPGSGYFYLVRPVGGDSGTGTYDNCWGPAQVCGRDPEINAAPSTCPPPAN